MPRIRTIKPEFWQDARLARDLERDQRLFYIGLWNQADDEGRFRAHPRLLLGAIFPFDDDIHGAFIEGSLRALADTGRVLLYEVDGERYGQLTHFSDHQRINRPTPSSIPSPPKDLQSINEDSLRAHASISEGSTQEVEVEREMEVGSGSKIHVASDAATALSVLEACNEITGRSLTLTTDRRRKIQARLREGFTSEQLLDAMRGAHADPFMRGENTRGKRYDDPLTVFKTAGKVEDHIEHWQRVSNGRAPVRELSKQERRSYDKTANIMTTPLSNGGHDADG